ncbi:RagB/SusD family nutrient uptake outer membrane protein [Bacteroides thetaiotaomicron]|nr:RagB/SusD family nutrient uptake outer membrane protein [Bacteroides thetaiotaomicron]
MYYLIHGTQTVIGAAYAFNTASSTNQDWLWGTTYQYIGQCYLFLQKLENAGSDIASDAEKEQWRAECQFLVAYYHFATLRRYGPIPITDSYIPMDTPTSEYNGRFHFDYCVDWIANQLDEAAKVLPANRTVTNEWGRATSTIAKVCKSTFVTLCRISFMERKFPLP